MKIILDGKRMTSKEETHAYLKEALDLPAYYGRNLDALYDCLTERRDLEIEVQDADILLQTLGSYGEKLLAVLRESQKEE